MSGSMVTLRQSCRWPRRLGRESSVVSLISPDQIRSIFLVTPALGHVNRSQTVYMHVRCRYARLLEPSFRGSQNRDASSRECRREEPQHDGGLPYDCEDRWSEGVIPRSDPPRWLGDLANPLHGHR